jgi:hypothetical protein
MLTTLDRPAAISSAFRGCSRQGTAVAGDARPRPSFASFPQGRPLLWERRIALAVLPAPQDEPPPGSSITGELPSSPDISRAVRLPAHRSFVCAVCRSHAYVFRVPVLLR